MTAQSNHADRPFTLERLSNYFVIVAFGLVIVGFSVFAEGFLNFENLTNLVVNKVVLLAIVSLGMTIVIASGGIDLSVGVSIDLSSMAFIMMIAAGFSGINGVLVAICAAIAVGLLNAVLINRLKIDPFLVLWAYFLLVNPFNSWQHRAECPSI